MKISKAIKKNQKPHPREGWSEAFQKMAEAGDDKLLDEDIELISDELVWAW